MFITYFLQKYSMLTASHPHALRMVFLVPFRKDKREKLRRTDSIQLGTSVLINIILFAIVSSKSANGLCLTTILIELVITFCDFQCCVAQGHNSAIYLYIQLWFSYSTQFFFGKMIRLFFLQVVKKMKNWCKNTPPLHFWHVTDCFSTGLMSGVFCKHSTNTPQSVEC